MQTPYKTLVAAMAFAGISLFSTANAANEILQFDVKRDGTGDYVQSQHGPIISGKTTVTVRFDASRLSRPMNPDCSHYKTSDKMTGYVKSGSSGRFGDTISFELSGDNDIMNPMRTGQFVAPRCHLGSSEINMWFIRDDKRASADGCDDSNFGKYYVFPVAC